MFAPPTTQQVDRWAYLEKAYNALQLPDPDCANCSEGARRLGRDFQVRNASLAF